MSKNILETLFGSRTRLKILRLLFLNSDKVFSAREISFRIQEKPQIVYREIKRLLAVGLIKLLKKFNFGKEEEIKTKNKTTPGKRRESNSQFNQPGYLLNPKFDLLPELRDLILKSSPIDKDRLTKQINQLGHVKLAVISGMLISGKNTDPLSTDLLIVGDGINTRKLRVFLKTLEANLGNEIKFAVMDKEEFEYRLVMFDRFIRVLLENSNEKLINKLGV